MQGTENSREDPNAVPDMSSGPGSGNDPTLAFVVAHFHPRGRVPANLLSLVRHFATLTRRVVFVSTGIAPEGVASLQPYAQVIARENFGYDFWSYKLGIDALGDRSSLRRLVLCNSSFVTLDPKQLCGEFLTAVEGPAIRGVTINAAPELHVQSYWVSFEHGSLINSAEFAQWWAGMVPISDRNEVIVRYEIGMSTRFAALGIPLRAAFQPTLEELLIALCRGIASRRLKITGLTRNVTFDLESARGLNPSHFLWDSIMKRFPIVKIDLLRNNPMQMDLAPLISQARATPALQALIEDALID